MRLEPKWMPRIALGAGVLGFGLRLWLLLTGTDQAGLMVMTHPAIPLLFILIAAAIAVFVFGIKSLTETPEYDKLLPASLPACVGCCIAAVCTVVSSLLWDLNFLGIVSALAAAGCLVFTGISRLKSQRPNYLFHAAITVYLVLHLVQQYQHWNTEPQLLSYIFPLLASVFLMVATYYRTAMDTSNVSYQPFAFFHWGALFFCCIGIAGSYWLFYLGMAAWVTTWNCAYEVKKQATPMRLSDEVLYCIDTLEQAGYSAYVVGGCVRDHLMGLKPHDYDMCTDASPEQICQLFARHNLVRSGEKHGTIGVVLTGEVFEITTFRSEGGYSDGRHPDWVEFVSDIKEDLARRDFTVNAIAYNPCTGYVDPFGGQQDIENKILRAVGDAETRFREDALRILRGVRFAVRFRFTTEESTYAAMISCAELMDQLARERVYTELSKLLPLVTAQDLLRYAPIVTQVISELAPTVGFLQNSPHHAYDVYTHTAYAVEATPPELTLRFAALLHDIGKPSTYTTDENGIGHFYDHAKVGAEMADQVLLRLKAPTNLRNQVVLLIGQHMTPFPADKKVLRRRLGKLGDETVEQLLSLQKADFNAKGVQEDEPFDFEDIELLLAQIRLDGSCLTAKDLAVNGSDLLALGVEPGPHIGECMKFLLSLVQDEILENKKEELLDAAKNFFEL